MRLNKLLSKTRSNPINIYCDGEYLGRCYGKHDVASQDLIEKWGNSKIDSIGTMILKNGDSCLQVYLKD